VRQLALQEHMHYVEKLIADASEKQSFDLYHIQARIHDGVDQQGSGTETHEGDYTGGLVGGERQMSVLGKRLELLEERLGIVADKNSKCEQMDRLRGEQHTSLQERVDVVEKILRESAIGHHERWEQKHYGHDEPKNEHSGIREKIALFKGRDEKLPGHFVGEVELILDDSPKRLKEKQMQVNFAQEVQRRIPITTSEAWAKQLSAWRSQASPPKSPRSSSIPRPPMSHQTNHPVTVPSKCNASSQIGPAWNYTMAAQVTH